MFWKRQSWSCLSVATITVLFFISISQASVSDAIINTTSGEPVDYTKGVFLSLDAIFDVFNMPEYRNIEEVKNLLEMFDRQCQFQSGKKYLRNRHRHIFVVIEGTPSSGSRFFSNKLVRHISGSYVMSPPNCFAAFRQFFDTQDFLLRSAFYALGNYIVAEFVKRTYFFKPVVVNRYWQSQAALGLTKEAIQGKGLPPGDSPLYRWPRDLLVPDIIFFLTKTQVILNPTIGEGRPVLTKQFTDLMIETYTRMRDPPVIDVDGGAFKTKTFTTIKMLVNLTQQHLIDTYNAMGFSQIKSKSVHSKSL
uniref:Uncharacterized protein n=1 Tax=Homalodisca liturata TaxID=320908 RepID=A0A1B6HA95_9HEMI